LSTHDTRQDALLAAFRDTGDGDIICVHRDKPGMAHENVYACPCAPIFIEKWVEMTEAEFLRIVAEETGH
jgi:hypothetical protein